MKRRKPKTPLPLQCNQRNEDTVPIEDCVKLLREFEDYDFMRILDSDVEIPEGETFYDPIYEEVWG